jgi:hypothetical protein
LGVVLSVSLSLTAWLVLLATYVPYILFYSPMVIVGQHETGTVFRNPGAGCPDFSKSYHPDGIRSRDP